MKGDMKKVLAMILSLSILGAFAVMPTMADATALYTGESSINVGGEEYVPCLYNANYEQESSTDTNADAGKYYESITNANGCVYERSQPANNATNGTAFKLNATSMTTSPSSTYMFYNIPIRDNSSNNKTVYKKEVAISFDVLRESAVRTPAYVLNINNNALRIGSAYINADGDLVVVHHAASTLPIYNETEEVTVCDTNLGLNTWNNITAVFNKDTGKISWYVDGTVQCTVDASKIQSSAAEGAKYDRYNNFHYGIANLSVFYPAGSTQTDINSVYLDKVKAGYNVDEKDVPEFGSEYYEYASNSTGVNSKDATCPIDGTRNYMISFDVSCQYIAGLSQIFGLYNNGSKISFGMYPANNEGRLVITNYGLGTAAIKKFFTSAANMKTYGGAAELNVFDSSHQLDSSARTNSFYYTATNAMIKKNEPFNLTYYVDVTNKIVKVYFDGFYIGETVATASLTDMSFKTLYSFAYQPNTAGTSVPALTYSSKYKIGYAKIDEPSAIEVSDLSVVDGNGVELVNSNAYDADSTVYAKASIKNNTSVVKECEIVIAQYDGDMMIDTNYYTVSLPAGNTVNLSEAVSTANLQLDENVTSVKAFVWSNMVELDAICNMISYSVSAE